jgi:glycosyltransferase involved in cell wall biosynthesis
MRIVHLMASPFVGGPERQVLGLAGSLPADYRTSFLSFAERGLSRPFLEEARRLGCEAVELKENAPHVHRAAREVADHLLRLGADVLCCSGYKPDLIGWWAARRAGVPVIAISHGWTAATLKVRANELLDRLVLRWMDRVVCVSAAQAVRVRRAGVPPERIAVIRNAIDLAQFDNSDPSYRQKMQSWFAQPRTCIITAAGRLSPEKGFDRFIAAAALVAQHDPGAGFVLFGEGPLREALTRQIAECGLTGTFMLAGFRGDVQRFLPWCDLAVLSSWTEGLPVIVLEALAAGVPVVATAVGGTPEVVHDGINGYLVPPGDSATLARRIRDVLRDEPARRIMGEQGRQLIREQFTFAAQAREYQRLFEQFVGSRAAHLVPLSPILGGEGLGVRGQASARHLPFTPNPSPPSTGERGENARCAH